MQGKVELAETLDTAGVVRRVWRGGSRRERAVGKAAGDELVFIPGRGSGWQMKPPQTPRRPHFS
jgi:hypothetical protein